MHAVPTKETATLTDLAAYYEGQKSKSIYNSNTVKNRLNAISHVAEAAAQLNLDPKILVVSSKLDDLARIMSNGGKTNGTSLKTYVSNFRGAVDDYFGYLDDPAYVPSARASRPEPAKERPPRETAAETPRVTGEQRPGERLTTVALLGGGDIRISRPNRALVTSVEIQQVMHTVLGAFPELLHAVTLRSPSDIEKSVAEVQRASTSVVHVESDA